MVPTLPAGPGDAPGSSRATGGPAVVYIVDPDGTESAAISALVTRLGARPLVLASAAALLAARPGPASCVVAEMRLPDTDGLQLLETLKSHGFTVPVIFITGDRDVGRAVTALRAGAVDYLVKPWIEQRLAARLRAALELPDSA